MRKYFLILFTALAFASCKQNETTSTPSIMPLQTGNYWQYADSTFDVPPYYIKQKPDTIKTIIEEFVTLKGESGYKYRFHGADSVFHLTLLFRTNEEGDHVTVGGFTNTDTLMSPSIRFKRKAVSGESWSYSFVVFSNITKKFTLQTAQMTCLNSDTTMVFKRVNYPCKVYSFSSAPGYLSKQYLSEGVGLLKTENFYNNKLISNNTLIDYQLK
jgi:hypothetical protein